MSKINITNKEIERKTLNFRKKIQQSFKIPNPLNKSLSPEINSTKNKQLHKGKEIFH